MIVAGAEGDDNLDFSGATLIGIERIVLQMGTDLLVSSLGADTIDAGHGNDVIRYVGASFGADTVDGGAGTDRIEAGADNTVIRLKTFTSIETITGAGFANVILAGSASADTLDLSAPTVSGIARIEMEAGDDVLVGSAGADVVRGGTGADTLSGGLGDDRFEYRRRTRGRHGRLRRRARYDRGRIRRRGDPARVDRVDRGDRRHGLRQRDGRAH